MRATAAARRGVPGIVSVRHGKRRAAAVRTNRIGDEILMVRESDNEECNDNGGAASRAYRARPPPPPPPPGLRLSLYNIARSVATVASSTRRPAECPEARKQAPMNGMPTLCRAVPSVRLHDAVGGPQPLETMHWHHRNGRLRRLAVPCRWGGGVETDGSDLLLQSVCSLSPVQLVLLAKLLQLKVDIELAKK